MLSSAVSLLKVHGIDLIGVCKTKVEGIGLIGVCKATGVIDLKGRVFPAFSLQDPCEHCTHGSACMLPAGLRNSRDLATSRATSGRMDNTQIPML